MIWFAADGEPAAIRADGNAFTSFGMRMLVELLPPAAASLDEELLDDCDELLDDDEEPKDEDPPPPAAPPPPLGWRKLAAASSHERYAKDFTRTKPHFSSFLASASFGTATRSI